MSVDKPTKPSYWAKVSVCVACGTLFESSRPNRLRCKPGCGRYNRWKNRSEVERQADRERAVRAGRLGAVNELRVAVDLLEKGWDVCVPCCNSCTFDLLAWKDGRAVRVQVKTSVRVGGKLRHGPVNDNHDVLALVLVDEVVYVPDVLG